MFNQRLIEYLRQTYGPALLHRRGATYPVYTFAPPEDQYDQIDSILAPPVPHEYLPPESFALYDATHLRALRASRPLTNGLSYVLDQFSVNPLRMTAKLGYYFDMLATCDAIDHEIRAYARGERDDLPDREQLHAAAEPAHLPFDGRNRANIIGAAVLTVFPYRGRYHLILAQRAGDVATDAGFFHVLPAFVMQPSGPEVFYPAEWSVSHQLYREFGEELFGMPEFDEWPGAEAKGAHYFYDQPPVAELRQMIGDGRAAMQLTGVAFNPLSTRIEICGLLLIHDPEWYPRWEDELKQALFTERQATHYIPLDTLEGLPDDLHQRTAPHGAAALWLGIDRARVLVGGDDGR